MQLDFPTSPAPNQVYSLNGKSWKWNGDAWETYNDNLGVDFVETVNGATGEIDVVGGTDISVSTAGKTVTVNYTGTSTNNAVTSFNGNTGAVQGVGAFMGKTGAVGLCAGLGITYSLVGNTYTFSLNYLKGAESFVEEAATAPDYIVFQKKPSGNTAAMRITTVQNFLNTLTVAPTQSNTIAGSNFLFYNNDGSQSYVQSNTAKSEILQGAVTSFNGLTGDVYGVSKVNGFTGDVTISTVDFVDGGTFA